MKNKHVNWWKWAFLSLCFILCALLIFIVVNVYPSSRELLTIDMSDDARGGASFSIVTGKQDINFWLEKELLKEQGDSNVDYRLFLDDYVYLQAEVEVFGMTLPFQLVLEPLIQENGNLLLEEHSFNVGDLKLPSAFVFQTVDAMFDLPDWMVIYPEEEMIYLNLRDGLLEDLQIEVVHFNLEEDKFEFSLTLFE